VNHIKAKITEELLTKTNKLNSAILRRGWFKESDLYKEIQNKITFTNNIGEQIYCILNDIKDNPKCPTCGDKLTFKMFKHGYSKTCNKNTCIRKNNKWLSCSETKRKNNINSKKTLFDCFKNNRYELKSKDDVLSYITKRIKDSEYGKIGKFVYDLTDTDMLCSVLYYTRNVVSTESNDWSERFYVLYNDINEIPKCIECGASSKYISFIKGYQKT